MALIKTTIAAPGDREIVLSRVFNAPRTLVFRAYTTPDIIRQWLGPEGWRVTECAIDLRPGGAYRFTKRHVSGAETRWSGVYSEVTTPQRLRSTMRYHAPRRSDETLATVQFSDEADGARLTVSFEFESPAARDEMLKSPMRESIDQSYDALERLLAQAASRDAA